MGVGSGGKARRRQEKTYRKNVLSRSRRTVFTHSHMGACSCYFAVASLVVFSAAVLASFVFWKSGLEFDGRSGWRGRLACVRGNALGDGRVSRTGQELYEL